MVDGCEVGEAPGTDRPLEADVVARLPWMGCSRMDRLLSPIVLRHIRIR